MPPRSVPKFFQLLLKTHRLTIVLTIESGGTIADVKRAAFDALTASVLRDHEEREAELRRQLDSVDTPEVSKAKDKGKAPAIDEDIDLDDADAELSLGGALPADMRLPDELEGDEQHLPTVTQLEDFELAKGYSDTNKGKPLPGVLPGHFEVLKENAIVKSVLQNWEAVYVQFREQSSGILMPVQVTPFPPPPEDEEETHTTRGATDRPPTPDLVPSSSARHKRKRSD